MNHQCATPGCYLLARGPGEPITTAVPMFCQLCRSGQRSHLHLDQRLNTIRSSPDRIAAIVHDLVTYGPRQLTRQELLWLRDLNPRWQDVFLPPAECAALIRALAWQASTEDAPTRIENSKHA